MKRSLADILRPGAADGRFELVDFCSDEQEVDYGVLSCPASGEARLILAGFGLFTETAPASSPFDLAALKSIEDELFGDPGEYERFVAQKWRRPNRDAYAAFQPFNESTRALYPLLPLLRAQLRPGDYILDTWCRTGWSGELLAALFPQQNIVSIWEGNRGALGYRAFRHWLGRGKRAANLDILFHDVNQPLPFNSGSFAAVIGLDTLHRYDTGNLVRECQRVCRDNAPVLFPHVHLTNNEPDPWFERGCRQEHGSFWNDYLQQASVSPARSPYIESEMALFGANGDLVVANNPGTSHYNALVGLVPQAWTGARLDSIHDQFAVDESSYIIVNPLLDVDLDRLRVGLRLDDEDGMTGHILSRHPGYRAYLESRLCRQLNPEQARALYWAGKVLPLGEIAQKLGTTARQLQQSLAPLVDADVVLLLSISAGMAQLNHYFANQAVVVPAARQNLAALWRDAVRRHGASVYATSVEDELALTYTELDSLVEVAAGRLRVQLPRAGAPVCVAARPNLESVVLFWAAQLVGSPFVAIDPEWSASRIAQIIHRHSFKLLFTDVTLPPDWDLPADTAVISFESATATTGQCLGFEQWLEDEELAELPDALPPAHSTSVILFTSGTTGLPKGVELAHQAIWQSAGNFSQYYGWNSDDVYLSLGNFATMSGLRNPLVACASAGCGFLIPDRRGQSGILEAVGTMGNHGVTIMGVVPAFIKRLAELAERLDPAMFGSLRFFLCTAANLQPSVARLVAQRLGVPVYNYYGLTETCGACIFMPDGDSGDTANRIGRPFDAIAQIVAADGRVIGDDEPGELRIYSGNLMNGYLDEPARSDHMIRDGWLYTGDICRWTGDGVIELRGREKDAIKCSSGALIYLGEVEQCLGGQPGIGELAVAGFVDGHGDDRLACFVKATAGPGADALLSRFNELLRQSLSPDHQLSSVICVDAFPRGANEKIQKDELVRLHWRSIGETSSHD